MNNDAYPRFSWRDLSWPRIRDTFDERRRLLALLRFSRPRTLAALCVTVLASITAAPLTAIFARHLVDAMTSAPAALLWPVAGFATAMLTRQAAEVLGRALKAAPSAIAGPTQNRPAMPGALWNDPREVIAMQRKRRDVSVRTSRRHPSHPADPPTRRPADPRASPLAHSTSSSSPVVQP
ncbi:hypothetical protein AB0I81_54390 [Nonomuraea sp. NPDC050404]|uniref:hypothetical protein n=1 Tax=Nonomuraea sp. NPDC050404 TaxID=3155783 RepID=UPI00340D64D1